MASTDQIIDNINNNVDIDINLFNHELAAIMNIIRELVKVRAVELLSNPLEFDFAMQKILTESGYYELVNRFINESYDKSYPEILALFEAGGLSTTFIADDIAKIKALKQLDMEFFTHIGQDASQLLKRDLYKYSLSDMDTPTMLANITASLDNTPLVKYSKTYIDTSITAFNQSVIDMKAEGIPDLVYVYSGKHIDSKTREFCKCVLKQRKYYSKSDGAKLKRDSRRRYNCRHYVTPINKDFAEDTGYKEGKFSC